MMPSVVKWRRAWQIARFGVQNRAGTGRIYGCSGLGGQTGMSTLQTGFGECRDKSNCGQGAFHRRYGVSLK